MKTCKGCGKSHDLSYFYRNCNMKDGHLNYCKDCVTQDKSSQTESRDKARFGGLREDVLNRDNYTCQICGMTNEEHLLEWGRSITVHHKDGNGRYIYKQNRNNNIDNMITLCLRCHGIEDNKFKGTKISLKGILK